MDNLTFGAIALLSFAVISLAQRLNHVANKVGGESNTDIGMSLVELLMFVGVVIVLGVAVFIRI